MRRAMQLDAETERMRSSLLSAVSHDLKTPLAGIVAAGTTLLEHHESLEVSTSRGLLTTIVEEGERLGRLLQLAVDESTRVAHHRASQDAGGRRRHRSRGSAAGSQKRSLSGRYR